MHGVISSSTYIWDTDVGKSTSARITMEYYVTFEAAV